MKSIILMTGLFACSFQTLAASCDSTLNNGGFEDGLSCWTEGTEAFGFKEVVSSYTDGVGTEYSQTDGSNFLNLWGSNDLTQNISWHKGNKISFDYAITTGAGSGTDADGALSFSFFGYADPTLEWYWLISSDSNFHTFTHTFTEDSPLNSLLVFQVQGTQPGGDSFLSDQDVAHVLIDNIRITVPEPSTVSLMAMAIFLGWRTFRKAGENTVA